MSAAIKPPFTAASAKAAVQVAEDSWNARDADIIPGQYTADTEWRYRDQFLTGRDAILPFLERAWPKQRHYKLKKNLWSFTGNRISVRFESEWQHSETGQWYRTHGNEHWEFDADGLVHILDLSANDVAITEAERRL